MIKAIVFDYGGVLSINTRLSDFFEPYAKTAGVDSSKLLNLMDEKWQQAKVGKIDPNLFWEKVSEFLKVDKEIVRKDLMDYFGFRTELLEMSKELKEKYHLAILSNQIEDWLEEVIEDYNLKDLFDVIVTSYGFKKAKPDKDIFYEVLRKLNVSPEETIFIDDKEKNTSAAKEIGMKTILFENIEQLKKELNNFGINLK